MNQILSFKMMFLLAFGCVAAQSYVDAGPVMDLDVSHQGYPQNGEFADPGVVEGPFYSQDHQGFYDDRFFQSQPSQNTGLGPNNPQRMQGMARTHPNPAFQYTGGSGFMPPGRWS